MNGRVEERSKLSFVSDYLAFSNCFVAGSAFMLVIVTVRDAEGDEAASEPAANKANDEAGDPSDNAWGSLNDCLGRFIAVLALDGL